MSGRRNNNRRKSSTTMESNQKSLCPLMPKRKKKRKIDNEQKAKQGYGIETVEILESWTCDDGHLLKNIPIFLVDAFNLIRQNGLETEGLFRREGNAKRINLLWGPYDGKVGIPECCTVHDVCCMVKRFLRDINRPLLRDLQNEFVKCAGTITNKSIQLEAILQMCHVLPQQYKDTLAFLMRQLKIITDHEPVNKMNAKALATVLTPTIFRETDSMQITEFTKMESIKLKRDELERKTQVIELLILNAQKIGVLTRREMALSPRMYSDLLPEDTMENENESHQPTINGRFHRKVERQQTVQLKSRAKERITKPKSKTFTPKMKLSAVMEETATPILKRSSTSKLSSGSNSKKVVPKRSQRIESKAKAPINVFTPPPKTPVLERDFVFSSHRKASILKQKGPADMKLEHLVVDVRPSVLYIQKNRKGRVSEMVERFNHI